jgi:2-amino-4-hydroxy-6-hydroxymethyldihydropteridine diphosphokinase
MKIVFLGIGTNLGNREENLDLAVTRIEEYIGKVEETSSVYETEPWGFRSRDEFLNQVIKIKTKLSPSGLLKKILMIESQLGRVREEEQFSSRIIDIDILLYENTIVDDKNLKIPHPLMMERKFVLVPLTEIAPDLLHPVLKETFAALLKSCKDKSEVNIYKP